MCRGGHSVTSWIRGEDSYHTCDQTLWAVSQTKHTGQKRKSAIRILYFCFLLVENPETHFLSFSAMRKCVPLQYISQQTILQQTYFIRFIKEMKVNLHKYHYPWVFSLDHLEAYPLQLFNSFCTDSACPGWGYMGPLLSLEFCHFTWILGLTDSGLPYGHILLQPLSACRNWVNIFILKVSHFARTLKLILVLCSKVIFSKSVIQYVSHKDTHQNLVSSSRKDKLE